MRSAIRWLKQSVCLLFILLLVFMRLIMHYYYCFYVIYWWKKLPQYRDADGSTVLTHDPRDPSYKWPMTHMTHDPWVMLMHTRVCTSRFCLCIYYNRPNRPANANKCAKNILWENGNAITRAQHTVKVDTFVRQIFSYRRAWDIFVSRRFRL